MSKHIRKLTAVILMSFILTGFGGNKAILAEENTTEGREYFSTGYKVTTQWNQHRKISALLTLPSVKGLGDESPLYSKQEAAYNYLGVERKGDTIDFGFYKSAKSQGTWKLFSFYVSQDQKTTDEAYAFIENKFPRSSGQYNSQPYYKIWSEYKEFSIPDNTQVFVQLYVSGRDEITLQVKYDNQEIKIPYRFKGANQQGEGLRFRRESNLLAYGEQQKIDGKMEARWEKMKAYDQKKSYSWVHEGFFYRDDANKANGLPKNIGVSKKFSPELEIVLYGIAEAEE